MVLPRCVSLSRVIEKTWDMNVWLQIVLTFLRDCWLTTYIRLHRSTTSTSLRIVCQHLPVAPSTLVFHAVGRRASSYFLGPGRARATTAAAPMNLLRPASLPLPRQRLFLRRSSGGTPFDFQQHRASLLFLYVERYILIPQLYQLSYMSDSLLAWAFSDRNDGRFVNVLF